MFRIIILAQLINLISLSAQAASTNNNSSFVQIPAGCFIMGNNFGDPYHIEMPAHEVCISRFNISPFTVTRSEFEKFITETNYITDAEKTGGCNIYNGFIWEKKNGTSWQAPGFVQDGNHPAVCVSWNDSNAYTNWLSHKLNSKFRLPTEAEWEYAARSGGKQERFAGSDDINKVAWYASNSGNKTHPVGKKQPNGLGLYDMSGNVWQWTGDWYDRRYYRISPSDNPKGATSGTKRIFRGGSWFYDQRGARTTYRDFAEPNFSSSYLGFRIVSATP